MICGRERERGLHKDSVQIAGRWVGEGEGAES